MNQIYDMGFEKDEWVVSEKIHGANASFYLNDEGIRCGKRSGFLKIGQRFFNWETVRDAYEDHLKLLYIVCEQVVQEEVDAKKGKWDGVLNIILYGELFGGYYPHDTVEADPTAMKVQKGIYYAPWNDFYAFDLKINGRFVHYNIFEEIMSKIGFHYAKALYCGPLKECLAYSNEFPTKLPQKLGLPSIQDNICEGVVIKPAMPLFFNNGERVILKNKNDKFSEVSKSKEPKKKLNLSLQENELDLYKEGIRYINENRLRNVLSKIGPVTDKMFGKVQGMFHQDVITDWRKDKEEELKDIDKKRVRVIEKNINNEVQNYVRSVFVDIIDGTF